MSSRRSSPVEIEVVPVHACGLELRLEILGRVPFLAMLSPAEVARVNRRFQARGYDAGETVYASGEFATHLFVVASGQVRLLQHSPAGRDVLLDLLLPGEYFGTLAPGGAEPYAETAVAQVPTCALAIGAEEFRDLLAAHPPVALAVLDLTAERLRAARDAVGRLSAYPVEQRIAAVLVRLAAKLGVPHEEGLLLQTPLSREDLAQMAGATAETASRVMSQLQRDGLITSGRQWVAIKDRDRLAALAAGEG